MSETRSTTPLLQDLSRGLRCRCPNCGEGNLFKAYLKSVEHCSVCNEEYHHHRADDLPAYFAIMIVGHIIVTAAIWVERHYQPDYWIHILLWLPLSVAITLAILQPIKGAAIAIQWRIGMHGFKNSRKKPDQNV